MVAATAGGDGAVVMAGFTAGSDEDTQNWRWDAVAVKLDANGEQEWVWRVKLNISSRFHLVYNSAIF